MVSRLPNFKVISRDTIHNKEGRLMGDGMNLSLHLVVCSSKGDILPDKQAEQVTDESITNRYTMDDNCRFRYRPRRLHSNTLYPALVNMDLEFGIRTPARK